MCFYDILVYIENADTHLTHLELETKGAPCVLREASVTLLKKGLKTWATLFRRRV